MSVSLWYILTIRKKGYEKKLLREIESYYPNKRFELFTSTRSIDNIKLYQKMGYKMFKEKKITDELVFVYWKRMAQYLDSSVFKF